MDIIKHLQQKMHILYSYGIRIYLNLLLYKAIAETNNR